MITRRDLTCYSAACAVPLRNGRYRAFGVGVYDGARASEDADLVQEPEPGASWPPRVEAPPRVVWGEWVVRSDGLLRLERDFSDNVAEWFRLATNENPAWVVDEWDDHVIETMARHC